MLIMIMVVPVSDLEKKTVGRVKNIIRSKQKGKLSAMTNFSLGGECDGGGGQLIPAVWQALGARERRKDNELSQRAHWVNKIEWTHWFGTCQVSRCWKLNYWRSKRSRAATQLHHLFHFTCRNGQRCARLLNYLTALHRSRGDINKKSTSSRDADTMSHSHELCDMK